MSTSDDAVKAIARRLSQAESGSPVQKDMDWYERTLRDMGVGALLDAWKAEQDWNRSEYMYRPDLREASDAALAKVLRGGKP